MSQKRARPRVFFDKALTDSYFRRILCLSIKIEVSEFAEYLGGSMRRIRYAAAASLDGFVAGPNGEADWITMDPDIDFNAFFRQFDTVLVGRRTFESMAREGDGAMPGMKTFVFSRTLQQSDHPKVTIVSENWQEMLTALRKQAGEGHLVVWRRRTPSQSGRSKACGHSGRGCCPRSPRRRHPHCCCLQRSGLS